MPLLRQKRACDVPTRTPASLTKDRAQATNAQRHKREQVTQRRVSSSLADPSRKHARRKRRIPLFKRKPLTKTRVPLSDAYRGNPYADSRPVNLLVHSAEYYRSAQVAKKPQCVCYSQRHASKPTSPASSWNAPAVNGASAAGPTRRGCVVHIRIHNCAMKDGRTTWRG